MPLSFKFFILSVILMFLISYEIYEIQQDRIEIEEAILQLHEREIGLHEYARLLELEIQDLKATKF